jgi:cell division protein FtsW (lipid II flippase)
MQTVHQRQGRLLIAAAVFLFLYAVILTLSPAVRAQSWSAPYRWSQWLGFALWAGLTYLGHRFGLGRLRGLDPYIFPAAALLSGWGLLTIWRLDPTFGLRQTIWLGISLVAFIGLLRLPPDLAVLRRYKYVLLLGGLLLTALTLLFGTNPEGYGPRLWLGCCGVYLQPSEPLKLLLVIYLAAYLSDQLVLRGRFFPLLIPTFLVTGLGLLLLVAQRDLGTATLFMTIYAFVLYVATGERRVLWVSGALLAAAGVIGYLYIDVIHARIDSWIDPWIDPSGQSYQIVQSLLAIANGGTLGRGPGLGSPSLVPVAQSDFIFSAIAEESGLIGSIGLLTVIGLFLARSLHAALGAPDRFRRYLAAGIGAYFGIQTLMIIGGNLRLLPLTGVTLPFVSYGGSSMLSAFVALALLEIIADRPELEAAPLSAAQPYYFMAGLLGSGLAIVALSAAWWAVVRGPELLARTDNPRLAIADRYSPRGALLDRNDQPIDVTIGSRGSFHRVYLFPDLGPVTGYIHPTYGEAGLEASLDDYLRGLQGNPTSLIWWDHVLYGLPPPGLNVRLTLDLKIQSTAERLLGDAQGAVVLLNSKTGEVLVMASRPTYDPSMLDSIGAGLSKDPHAPLLNRAAQGGYPVDAKLAMLFLPPGAPVPSAAQQVAAFDRLGFYTEPQLPMAVAGASPPGALDLLRVSPLQMAIGMSMLSSHGVRPAPRILVGVDTPQAGWVVPPAGGAPLQEYSAQAADAAANALAAGGLPYWEWGSQESGPAGQTTRWFVAGTLPDWPGTPLTVVVLADSNIDVRSLGEAVLQAALTR